MILDHFLPRFSVDSHQPVFLSRLSPGLPTLEYEPLLPPPSSHPILPSRSNLDIHVSYYYSRACPDKGSYKHVLLSARDLPLNALVSVSNCHLPLGICPTSLPPQAFMVSNSYPSNSTQEVSQNLKTAESFTALFPVPLPFFSHSFFFL